MLTEAVTSEKKGAPDVEHRGMKRDKSEQKRKRLDEKNVISPRLEIHLSWAITLLIR